MAKTEIPFADFLLTVEGENLGFIGAMHDALLAAGCTVKLQSAKSGYVVSYADKATGKVLMNYVMRKKGPMARIYADNLPAYAALLPKMPEGLQATAKKSAVCRRMLDATKCNSRCPMGYVYSLDGEEYKKCRYNAFLFPLSGENNPHIQALVQAELAQRAG